MSTAAGMHPRISVNGVSFPKATLAEDIATWQALGAHTVGNHVRKLQEGDWDDNISALKRAGPRVESLVHPIEVHLGDAATWEVFRGEFRRTLAAGKLLGVRSIYSTSGHRGNLTWEDAAGGFCELMRPLLAEARADGMLLLIEPTVPLHADKSIVHTLRDTVTLAEMSGLGICLDIFHCWTEAALKPTLRRAIPRTHLVQVGDYVFGDRAVPCRAVIGDGNIPLERLIGWMLELGYTGYFDIEQNGPRIEKEGYLSATRRGIDRLSEMLVRLGA